MAVPWLTEMVGLASGSSGRGEGDRGRETIKEDPGRHSHRGTQRSRDGLELYADTLELNDWAQTLDLLLILGVISGNSLPFSKPP